MIKKPIVLILFLFFISSEAALAAPQVKLVNRQLLVDFDQDNKYEPFFVKGVGYAPIPIGNFRGSGVDPDWSSKCWYTGPNPLQNPDLRFERDSPDASFECGQDGDTYFDNLDVFDRDFSLMRDMKANTIRTWGYVTPELLQKANEYGLKIMAGFWVSHSLDYTFPLPNGSSERQAIIDDFVNYVNTYKDDPAILMWGLSNENNLGYCSYVCPPDPACDRDAQEAGYYQLMNDMALAAKAAEGTNFHPIIIVTAGLTDDLINHSNIIPDVDILGINSYRGDNFDGWPNPDPNLFDEFDIYFPNKSIIVTEFGADAWNSCGSLSEEKCIIDGIPQVGPDDGVEDQSGQAQFVTSAWDEIVNYSVAKGGPANGGVVFVYSDYWTGVAQRQDDDDPDDPCVWISSYWTPSVATHDTHFIDPLWFGFGVAPDNLVNEEWWGLVSKEQNLDGSLCNTPAGVDCVYPRQVLFDLQEKFQQPRVYLNVTPATITVGEPITVRVSGDAPLGLSAVWWFVEDKNDPTWHEIPGMVDGEYRNLAAAQNFGTAYNGVPRTVIFNEPGDYEIKANARDTLYPVPGEVHQASEGMGIPVLSVNVLPVIESASSTFIVGKNENLSFTVDASDIDGDELTLEVIDLMKDAAFKTGATEINPDGSSHVEGQFQWKSKNKKKGKYVVSFRAKDERGGESILYQVEIIVQKK